MNSIKNGFTNLFNGFSQSSVGSNVNSFLASNTLIAKFVFIILIVIIFVYLLSLGIVVIEWLVSPPSNPYVVWGMIDGGSPHVIYSDPTQSPSAFIARSNDRDGGIEFTWSVWLYVGDIGNYAVATPPASSTCSTPSGPAAIGKLQHIFNKGNNTYNVNNVATVSNCPGLYLSTETNSIYVVMDTIDPTDNNIFVNIDNIPIKKWFHVAIRVKNTVLDVYINGVIAQRLLLSNVPNQNYENTYVCQQGGFTGNLSNLRYYKHALNVFEISSIVNNGPNVAFSPISNSIAPNKKYDYLSKSWYSYNN